MALPEGERPTWVVSSPLRPLPRDQPSLAFAKMLGAELEIDPAFGKKSRRPCAQTLATHAALG